MATATVKVILPEKFNTPAFQKELEKALKETEKGMLKDFDDTTETWKHKVSFEHGTEITERQGRAFVETDDEIYGYVNDGTDPHPITPHGPYPLRFQWGGKGSYRPKTKPGRFRSTPGGPSGPMVAFHKVQHPGTDARKFDELIGKRWLPLFRRQMEYAVEDAAKASGHGIP